MDKIKLIILISCLLLCPPKLAYCQGHETYMNIGSAQKQFGTKTFDKLKFKNGDRKLKGEMAADLISKKSFIGKPLKSVTELLGPSDGYFENKAIPAYLISPDLAKKDTWQIIFLPDKDWKNVDEVKIHKNCCD